MLNIFSISSDVSSFILKLCYFKWFLIKIRDSSNPLLNSSLCDSIEYLFLASIFWTMLDIDLTYDQKVLSSNSTYFLLLSEALLKVVVMLWIIFLQQFKQTFLSFKLSLKQSIQSYLPIKHFNHFIIHQHLTFLSSHRIRSHI